LHGQVSGVDQAGGQQKDAVEELVQFFPQDGQGQDAPGALGAFQLGVPPGPKVKVPVVFPAAFVFVPVNGAGLGLLFFMTTKGILLATEKQMETPRSF
tara:strand:- start:3940 stop:4233 length:294 start_codon:yes stop_codon:yes gene_type:complete